MLHNIVTTNRPRQRMIQSAALLMRERGVASTSVPAVLAHSGAPRGSVYHHFPGGKAELIEEATGFAGDFIAAGFAAALAEDDDPATAVRHFAAVWRDILRDSDFADGCPIVAAALEGEREPAARRAAGAAFQGWIDSLSAVLRHHGVAEDRASSLATMTIAAIEGGVVLARAQRSTEPLDRVTVEIESLLSAELASSDPAS
jgi:TetR/AcrR family transcriptional regulator, lmrAB and yxaGH operons repressor